MANIEKIIEELTPPVQEAVNSIVNIWKKYRTTPEMTPSERAEAIELIVSNLPPDIKKIFEDERNGTSLLREITLREYNEPTLPRVRKNIF